MIERLHAMNVKLMVSVWSKIDPATEVGKQFTAKGYYIPGTQWIDFFNPAAQRFIGRISVNVCYRSESMLGGKTLPNRKTMTLPEEKLLWAWAKRCGSLSLPCQQNCLRGAKKGRAR